MWANGSSIPVCTEQKATGKYMLECFLSVTISNLRLLHFDYCSNKLIGDRKLIISTYPMSQKLRGAPRLLFGNVCD